MPKHHERLKSPTTFVLVIYYKFDFYNITEIADIKYKILDRVLDSIIIKRIFAIYHLAVSLIIESEKDVKIQIQISNYNR